MMLFLFVVVAQALAALVFIKVLQLPGKWACVMLGMFIAANLPLPYIIWLVSGARQPPTFAAALFVRPAFAWFFGWLCFLVFLGPVVLLGRSVFAIFGVEAVFQGVRWFAFCMVALCGAVAVGGLFGTVARPRLTRLEIVVPGLASQWDGLRVAHLTDTHLAWWNSEAEFLRIGRTIAEQDPDLLLVTGDVVDYNPDYVAAFARGLSPVQSRFGRFAIIGNHDVYTGKEEVAERMERHGFEMLRDRWVRLEDGPENLVIAGLEDSGKGWTGKDLAVEKLPRILTGLKAEDRAILLLHRPVDIESFSALPVFLVLAGHTHGGQLGLPFGGPGLADLTYRHSRGLYQNGWQSLFVNQGTGSVGFPFRLFCPAEIALITLRSTTGHISKRNY